MLYYRCKEVRTNGLRNKDFHKTKDAESQWLKQIGRKDVRCRHQTDLSIGAYELNEEPGA